MHRYLSLVASVSAVGILAAAPGCSAESGAKKPEGGAGSTGTGAAPGTGGFPATGGVTGTTGGVTGAGGITGTGGSTAATCTAASATAVVVDDMEDGDNALSLAAAPLLGYWYAYNDGSGTQVPAEDTSGANPFAPNAGGSTTSPLFAACTTGTGFSMWGGGIGFNLLDLGGGNTCPVNLSGVTGVRFSIKGTGSIRLQVSSKPTASAPNGGTCTGSDCDYHANFPIPMTADWSSVSVPWSMLGAGVAPFDATTALGIQFQAYGDPPPDWNFCVDDVTLF